MEPAIVIVLVIVLLVVAGGIYVYVNQEKICTENPESALCISDEYVDPIVPDVFGGDGDIPVEPEEETEEEPEEEPEEETEPVMIGSVDGDFVADSVKGFEEKTGETVSEDTVKKMRDMTKKNADDFRGKDEKALVGAPCTEMRCLNKDGSCPKGYFAANCNYALAPNVICTSDQRKREKGCAKITNVNAMILYRNVIRTQINLAKNAINSLPPGAPGKGNLQMGLNNFNRLLNFTNKFIEAAIKRGTVEFTYSDGTKSGQLPIYDPIKKLDKLPKLKTAIDFYTKA